MCETRAKARARAPRRRSRGSRAALAWLARTRELVLRERRVACRHAVHGLALLRKLFGHVAERGGGRVHLVRFVRRLVRLARRRLVGARRRERRALSGALGGHLRRRVRLAVGARRRARGDGARALEHLVELADPVLRPVLEHAQVLLDHRAAVPLGDLAQLGEAVPEHRLGLEQVALRLGLRVVVGGVVVAVRVVQGAARRRLQRLERVEQQRRLREVEPARAARARRRVDVAVAVGRRRGRRAQRGEGGRGREGLNKRARRGRRVERVPLRRVVFVVEHDERGALEG
jgi:hypothetical protein